MIETRLWRNLRQHLPSSFWKLSDRYTVGIPDVVGCHVGIGFAMELKESKRTKGILVRYRPGQVPNLRKWAQQGGVALTVLTVGRTIYAFTERHCEALEAGVSLKWAAHHAVFQTTDPKLAVSLILEHGVRTATLRV